MAAVQSTRKNGMLLIGLLFVQLVLMSASIKGLEGPSLLEGWLVKATSPVVWVAEWIGGGVRGMWRGSHALIQAHGRNAELESEINRLRSELRGHREASKENGRLRGLLSMREDLESDGIVASIVTANVTGSTRVLVIDQGVKEGLSVDLPVVSAGGAVGRIVAVFDHYSKVLLLTDSDSGVGAVVQRSRAQGVVLGKGSELFELQYVPRFSDVVEGDRVVTSALDGVFPRGFEIGTVVTIEENADGTKRIVVQPKLDYGSLEEVLVLMEPSGGGVVDLPDSVKSP
jgi:rod shape-determining protein MreC